MLPKYSPELIEKIEDFLQEVAGGPGRSRDHEGTPTGQAASALLDALEAEREGTHAAILDLMDQYNVQFKQAVGGYSDVVDSDTVPGMVVVASADENGEPNLEFFRWEDLEARYAEARYLMTGDDPFDNLVDAWGEAGHVLGV